jgi:hypothetical protein
VTPVMGLSIEIAVLGGFRLRNEAEPKQELQSYCRLSEFDISQWAGPIPFLNRK